MSMTKEEFEKLVSRLEIYAKSHPNEYKFRVGLLAILGHIYIVAVLGILIAAIIGLILLTIYGHYLSSALIKLIFVLMIPVFIILRSLFNVLTMRLPPPNGIELQRSQVPLLFKLVDHLTSTLQCPSFNHIVLVPEFNAAVVQIPRFFLLGQDNYLLVGLPLLHALSVEQFEAVLAHEFGHLSGNHSHFHGWIYRMRHTWGLILERFAQSQQGGVGGLFFRFFNWYIPFFNAYSFVLARANEYEADKCAAQLAGPVSTASALVNVHVLGQLVDNNFWNEIYQKVNEQPEPPVTPFNQLEICLKTDREPEKIQLWLEQALKAKTDCVDTHPCLSDRLKALNFAPEEAAPLLTATPDTAAQELLGEQLTSLTEDLNQQWKTLITFQWRERYTYLQQSRNLLQELEELATTDILSVEQMWERARLTVEIKGPDAAIPVLKSLLSSNAAHANGNYLLGQILISRQNDEGIKYLKVAMNNEPQLVVNSCEIIYYYLQQQGREIEANQFLQEVRKRFRFS
ncbi:M48 family metallopeptidase [Gloeothece verrucosa]|uniref:Peptidase M48 Ste24p n=1 Tax=Gloeothece verrucosa (strain PCC 7822) TaxID=497965 RepID=E0UFH7_GLOV7|nr:M48 family metallopeptidase [Gloeothece verrucosa]ADN16671.1 peptidase M48 Ste24p [Gloeothece verrucosa PCC 7822]